MSQHLEFNPLKEKPNNVSYYDKKRVTDPFYLKLFQAEQKLLKVTGEEEGESEYAEHAVEAFSELLLTDEDSVKEVNDTGKLKFLKNLPKRVAHERDTLEQFCKDITNTPIPVAKGIDVILSLIATLIFIPVSVWMLAHPHIDYVVEYFTLVKSHMIISLIIAVLFWLFSFSLISIILAVLYAVCMVITLMKFQFSHTFLSWVVILIFVMIAVMCVISTYKAIFEKRDKEKIQRMKHDRKKLIHEYNRLYDEMKGYQDAMEKALKKVEALYGKDKAGFVERLKTSVGSAISYEINDQMVENMFKSAYDAYKRVLEGYRRLKD